MYHNPLIYCTCWDPRNLGPRKLIKTLQPPNKAPTRKSKLTPLLPATKEQNYLQSQPSTKPVDVPKVKTNVGRQEEGCKSPYEVINVSPGYQLARNREQISVTLGDEMFGRKKRLESEMMDKFNMSRTNIISDLEEQISELTALIEQMNRDHQADQKLLFNEMELQCAEMKQNFENKNRGVMMTLLFSFGPEEMEKEYKYLKNMFHMYQDSIYDEIEEKWSKRKAEWEKDEKLEREKILLQQKHKMTKKFELESEEEKKKITESYSASIENLISEKEELLKQHESDTLQLQELSKTKAIMEEELHAQAIILESLNAHLYQTQMELQKEKATVGNLEKMFQIKLAEANEKHKHTIESLTEENLLLRQKIAKNGEEVYERQSGTLPSLASYEYNYDYDIEYGNKKQES
ncbi:flagellum-associated coiled-coil domain-containing protein 1 isoform X2 [Marmota marmota marmota]|uniref:flagellum-associated coiled-coil domain-containing protein 1 isoform X2 n=1 Tax=Marmota marmota marmota TaxID=9994 RepID=UPI002093BD14|nr:flagellum-associated coiled-coil domain-containing protein 1 isoform X2 [Marmota marmota marmota]